MKPFDRRLQKDLFPKTPVAFRETVRRSVENACGEVGTQQTPVVHFPADNNAKPARKKANLFTRIGTVAIAAVLMISLLAVGTIAVLAGKEKTAPAANVPADKAIEPVWSQHAEVILLPDYIDRETGDTFADFAALREENGIPAYSEEAFSWLKTLESETVYLDLNGQTIEYETTFTIPEQLRDSFDASPINGDAYTVVVEADVPRFALDDMEAMPADGNLWAYGSRYYYSDAYANRGDMDPFELAVGQWYSFHDAFTELMKESRTLTVQTTYRVYDRAYFDQTGDDAEEMALNRRCSLVGVIEQTMEIDLEKLMTVDAECRAELALSGTHTLTVMQEQDDGSYAYSDEELNFDGLVLNEAVQYRATGVHVTLSVKDLPDDWEEHYGTSLLYPSSWVAENMYGLSAKLILEGQDAPVAEARAMEETDGNRVMFVFPVAANDAYGAELQLYLKAEGDTDAQKIIGAALPVPETAGLNIVGSDPTEPPTASAEPETVNTVYAATVDEFLSAIAPDTEIVLTGEIYNLTTASDYGTGEGRYYRWREVEDGYELYLHDLNNFRLIGSENTQIVTDPRHAAVINAENCVDLFLSNITAGHTLLPEVLCSGPVLQLSDCTNARVEDCGLFGCGRVGVSANGCSGLTVSGCDIYECSNEGISLFECRNVVIVACRLRDCGLRMLSDDTEPTGASDMFFIGSCEHVIIADCDIYGNKALSVIGCAASKDVVLYGTLVYDNTLDDVISIEDAEMTVYGCEFRHTGNFLYKTSYTYKILDQNGNEIGETELKEMKLERDPYAN